MSKPRVTYSGLKNTLKTENPKLQRQKQRLSPYFFTTTWRKGKNHFIPNALSRAPVRKSSEEDLKIDWSRCRTPTSFTKLSVDGKF